MRRKKFLSVFICLALAFTLLPTVAMAGTVTVISDRNGLAAIGSRGSYRLTADIDLAGADWTPLASFSGTLDGGGHVIRNLSITDTAGSNRGLFVSIVSGGTVQNLGIEGANITAGDNVGIIAASNAGTIRRCYTTGTVSGGNKVGGVAGTNSGTIENCFSRATVSGTDYLGGLAGSNSGTVNQCYAASTVTDSVLKNYLDFEATDPSAGDVRNSGGYIEIPHHAAYSGNAFTVEAWFQWDDLDASDTAGVDFIFGKSNPVTTAGSPNTIECFEIHTIGDNDGLRFIPVPNGVLGGYRGDSWIDVKNVLQTGWFHVAAVYSYSGTTASVQVYVNGEAQDLWQSPSAGAAAENTGTTAELSRTENPLASNTYPINIGRRTDGTLYFDGRIADVRFWNTARTAEEIKTNKDKMLSGNEEGLVGYWMLNDSLDNSGGSLEGQEVDDATSNNNNGTIHGAVTHITGTAAANKGALVGSGTVTSCYYDSTVYGSSANTNGTAKTTAEMKTADTFTGWDFGGVWKLESGSYPSFRAISTVAVTGGTGSGEYVEGGTVTITADAPETGKRFKEWTISPAVTFADSTCAANSTAKFTMPAGDVTVTATYDDIPTKTYTLYYNSTDGKLHQGGTDGPEYAGNYSGSGSTLTLTDFHFTTTARNALELPGGTTLVLYGTNTVTSVYTGTESENSDGIYMLNGALTVSSESTGSLTATGGTVTVSKKSSLGIHIDGNITVEGGMLIGKGGISNNESYGVYASGGGSINVSGTGVLNGEGGEAVGNSYGVCASYDITVSGTGVLNGTGGKATTTGYGVCAGNSITVGGTGSLTATGGTSSTASYGAYTVNGTITASGGSVEASGNTSALNKSPIFSLENYKYKTNTAATEPDAAYTRSRTAAYSYDSAQKYLSILPDGASAAVGAVTVSGTAGIPITGTNVTVTLTNDTFASSISGDWITNLPTGLTQSVTRTGDTTATIAVSGTPESASGAALAITIPAASLVSNADLTVTSNASAVYAIKPAAPDTVGTLTRKASSLTVANAPSTMEYTVTLQSVGTLKGSEVWSQGSGEDLALSSSYAGSEATALTPATYYRIWFRVKNAGGAPASDASSTDVYTLATAPVATMTTIAYNVTNAGGTQELALNTVSGIIDHKTDVKWTMTKTDASGILTLPEPTTGVLANVPDPGKLILGSVTVAANPVGAPAKTATVTITFSDGADYAELPAPITVTFNLAIGNAPDAPALTTDIVVTQPTASTGDASKGSITIAAGKTATDYEYRLKVDGSYPEEWTEFSAAGLTAITPPATYQVRVKAAAPGPAGAALEITISAYVAPSSPTSDGGDTTPAAPVVVDGKTERIGKAETTATETKVTVDSAKLTEKVESAHEGGSVVVAVDSSKDTATAQLVVKNVEDMAKKDMTLTVKAGGVSYELPTIAVDTAAIMKELGADKPADVPVSVTITTADAAVQKAVKAAAENAGAEVIGTPTQFTVTATFGGKTVNVSSFDSFVSRIMEVTAAQAKKMTTAIVHEEDGSIRHVPTFVYQQDDKWYAKINSLTNSTYALIYNEQSFADAAGKWYQSVVEEMASRKVISGYADGTFGGDGSITRAEFAAILVCALGLPTDGTANFTDVKPDDWYFGAVGTAAEYGLVTGYGDGSFGPTANITREEAMVMVRHAAKVAEYAGTTGALTSFSDASSVSSWAQAAAEFNVGSGLIKGDAGALRPTDSITRAESAVVILRLLQKAELVDVRANA